MPHSESNGAPPSRLARIAGLLATLLLLAVCGIAAVVGIITFTALFVLLVVIAALLILVAVLTGRGRVNVRVVRRTQAPERKGHELLPPGSDRR